MKDYIKSRNIPFESMDDLQLLQESIRQKYLEARVKSPKLTIYDLKKDNFYQDLSEVVADRVMNFELEIGKNKNILDLVSTPGKGFYLGLLNQKDLNRSFRSSNLNACYLFAYDKLKDDYDQENRTSVADNLKNDSTKETQITAGKGKNDDHLTEHSRHTVRIARYADIRKIHNIAATVYEGIDVIPTEKMLEWYDKNPYSFHVIVDEDDEIVGNIDILPLKDEALKKFLKGRIIEREIKADDIWGVDEKDKMTSLYVESVVNKAGDFALTSLLRAVSDIIKGFHCEAKCLKKNLLYFGIAKRNTIN
jgi:hypothetical protein